MGRKLSVSLSEADLSFIDAYAGAHGSASRSSVVQAALAALRDRELGIQYEAAWGEWGDDDAALWESAVADGLDPTPSTTADATR